MVRSTEGGSGSQRLRLVSLFAVCLLVSLALYAQSFDNSFRADDFPILTHVITEGLPRAMAPTPHIAFFRPASVALAFVEAQVFGLRNGLYLAFNFFLHLANSLLAIRIFLTLGFGRRTATLAGALFLLGYGHYGKVVMWASSGGALLSAFSSLAAILLALQWAKRKAPQNPTPGMQRWLVPVGTAALLLLAMLSYEVAVLTPALVVAIVAVYDGRRSVGSLSRAMLFLIPAIVWSWLALVVFRVLPQYQNFMGAVDAPVYFVKYHGFLALPVQRSSALPPALHGLNPLLDHAHPVLLGLGAVCLAVLAAAALQGTRKIRLLVLWVFLTIVPFTFVKLPSGFLELRYVYLAAIPFCGLVACGFERLLSGKSPVLRGIALGVLLSIALSSMAVVYLLEQKYDGESRSMDNAAQLTELRALMAKLDRE